MSNLAHVLVSCSYWFDFAYQKHCIFVLAQRICAVQCI